MKKLIFILIFLFLIVPATAEINKNYIINGTTQYIDDENVYLGMDPYSLPTSDFGYITFTPKNYTGPVDLALGYNSNDMQPVFADYYSPHEVQLPDTNHTETFYFVSNVRTTTLPAEIGNDYNTYKRLIDYKLYDGYDNETQSEIWIDQFDVVIAFDSYQVSGTNYTVQWHTHHSETEEWTTLPNEFSNLVYYSYDGLDRWRLAKDLQVEAGNTYLLRVWFELPVELGATEGKYAVALKPSSQTLSQSIESETIYYLDPYWNSSWTARRWVPYNQTAINSTVGIMPLKYWFIQDGIQANGVDIRVVYENGTQAPREVEFYNDVTNVGAIWVLADTSDLGFWMYWGNAAASEPPADSAYGERAVWEDYVMVSHMKDVTTSTIKDSATGNTFNKLSANNPLGTAETYGYSQDFSTDFINGGINASYQVPTGSIEVYTKIDSEPASVSFILGHPYDNGSTWNAPYIGFQLARKNTDNVLWYGAVGGIYQSYESTTNAFQLNTPYFVATSWNGSYAVNYINGVQDGFSNAEGAGDILYNYPNLIFGMRSVQAAGEYLDGKIYEARISTSIHSLGSQTNTWKNLKNPSEIGTGKFYNTSTNSYLVDSLYYNATSNYLHTLDGGITVNRTIIESDNTYDTALSTNLSTLVITAYSNINQLFRRNLTISGSPLDWYMLTNQTTQELKLHYRNGTYITRVNSTGDANFTDNISAGYYVITTTPDHPYHVPINNYSIAGSNSWYYGKLWDTYYDDNRRQVWREAAGKDFNITYVLQILPRVNVVRDYTLNINGYYNGNPAHGMNVWIYNNITQEYDLLGYIPDNGGDHNYTYYFQGIYGGGKYQNATTEEILVKFAHVGNEANGHYFYVDEISLYVEEHSLIESYSPALNYSSLPNVSQTFNATFVHSANGTWYINGTEYSNFTDQNSSNISLSYPEGIYNVTLYVWTNSSIPGEIYDASLTWTWTVVPPWSLSYEEYLDLQNSIYMNQVTIIILVALLFMVVNKRKKDSDL